MDQTRTHSKVTFKKGGLLHAKFASPLEDIIKQRKNALATVDANVHHHHDARERREQGLIGIAALESGSSQHRERQREREGKSSQRQAQKEEGE